MQKQSKNVKTNYADVYGAKFVSPSPCLPNHCIGFASMFEGYEEGKYDRSRLRTHMNNIQITTTIIAQE